MKKFIKSLMFLAVAAMTFTSCQNEIVDDNFQTEDTYTMTFVADAPQSRTSVTIEGETAQFDWADTGESVAFVQWDNEKTTANKKKSDAYSLEDGKAKFGATFDAIANATGYNYIAVYPNDNYVSHDLAANKIRVQVPAIQTITANTFDPNADLLISAPITDTDAMSEAVSLSFARVASVGKMTLKGVKDGENIKTVTFIWGEEKNEDALADKRFVGRYEFNFDGNVAQAAYWGKNYVELSTPYGEEFLATNTGTDIYFTCLPGAYSGTYTVEVVTDKAIYSKSATLDAAKALNFTAGNVLSFGLGFTEQQREALDVVEDYSGQYLVAAFDDVNYILMSSDSSTAYRPAVNSGVAEYEDYNAFGGVITDALVWNVAKDANGDAYTFANYDNTLYFKTVSDSNNAYLDDESVEKVLLTKNTETGTFTIQSTTITGRRLGYNKGAPRFCFYTGSTQNFTIYLIPFEGKVKSNVTMTFDPASVSLTVGEEFEAPTLTFNKDGEFDVTYSVKGDAGVASVVDNVVVCDAQTAGTATVTASFEGNEDYFAAEAKYTITVKEPVDNSNSYVKVTDVKDIAVGGKYLLVYETSLKVFTGFNGDYGLGGDIPINEGTITVGDVANRSAAVLTLEEGSTAGTYSFKLGDVYLSLNSDGNKLHTSGEKTANSSWTIEITDGEASIKNAKYTSRYLQWNTSSPRFACYTGTQSAIQLYKFNGEIPELTALDTPTVTATATGNTIAVSWNAIDGAASYTVTCGTSVQIVSVTDYTFEGLDYSKPYDITIVANPSNIEEKRASAPGTATATTEADPNAGGGEPVTVTKQSFTSSDVNSGSLDGVISYTTAKNNATTAPAYYNNGIRLYQNNSGLEGGSITFTAKDGYKITSVSVTSTSTYATTIGCVVDGATITTTESLAKSSTYTIEGQSASSVKISNYGNTSSKRLEIASVSVTYVAE